MSTTPTASCKQRLIRPGDTHINQPWAVAMAPSNFGSFSNDLLVGNFGDGTINAFNPKNGRFVGELKNANGQPIAITHLWGLAFGNGGAAGPTNTLYFTAGLTSHLAPSDAPFHGLFGSLQVARRGRGGDDGRRRAAVPVSNNSVGMSLLRRTPAVNQTRGSKRKPCQIIIQIKDDLTPTFGQLVTGRWHHELQ